MLGGLHQPGMDASPPMMREVEPPRLVLCDEIRRILWLDTTEVVTSREHEDVPGEAVSAYVGDLPRLIRPEL